MQSPSTPSSSGGLVTSAVLERVRQHPLQWSGASSPEETRSAASSAVSLIQSAARSILDEPGADLSDHEDNESDNRKDRNSISEPLHSLQARVLPAMPHEQDRKRFLGCLAAVLARAYSYDTLGEKLGTGSPVNDPDVVAFFQQSESEVSGESDPLPSDEQEQQQQQASPETSMEISMSDSFDYFADVSNGNAMAYRPLSNAAKRVLNRHRKRRYSVLSDLLLSSSDMLLIEKGSAKAFLPMLSKLLVPWTNEEQTQKNYSSCGNNKSGSRRRRDVVSDCIDSIEFLRPFLESMSPGSGFRCLALCLLQYLLRSERGYDARIRHALKTVGVLVLVHDMEQDPVDVLSSGRPTSTEKILLASRKFENLEHWIARELLVNSTEAAKLQSNNAQRRKDVEDESVLREQTIRRWKIGGTAVVAGTLFAVTGGLAAPGIATSVAAIASGTAATAAAAAMLTNTAAVTVIFGIGGGSLAAYKMQRRTEGLTEFSFVKESSAGPPDGNPPGIEAELFSTICLSGWCRDHQDFQRPWGVNPSNPPLTSRLELLQRFYHVYKPTHVSKCERVLEHWKGEENQLWKLLEQKYGRDPDHLLPFSDGPKLRASLTLEQKEVVRDMFTELVHGPRKVEKTPQKTPFERMTQAWGKRQAAAPKSDPLHPRSEIASDTTSTAVSSFVSGNESLLEPSYAHDPKTEEREETVPSHVRTVWDYKANYGGELYTVRWESSLLLQLCDSVADLAFELVRGGTAQLLRHTVLSAFAWPYTLVHAANMIDGNWILAVERSDEAGKELARSLLFSSAGNRPVTLAGYSFGARVVYSCLKELARYQNAWEDRQEEISLGRQPRRHKSKLDEELATMREPASIVEDVILMGLPNHLSISSWEACRQVVAGRLVNCYSQRDLILSLMFQLKRFGGLKPVCGVCPVRVAGVENVDVGDLISVHQDYATCTGEIFERVRLGQPFSNITASKGKGVDVSKFDV